MGMLHGFRGLVYVQSFSLDEHSAFVNKKYQLSATITPSNATNQNIKWTSSNTSIATVDNNGLVTPTGEGNVIITATLDGYTDSCELEVELIPVTGVSLNKSSTTIQVGETEQLVAIITPNDASDKSVTWSSSNTSVATVDSTGLVTYVGDGSCTITVTTENGGYTATCSVTCVSKRKVCFLLIGGGGSGNYYRGAGGGAGGVIQCTNYEIDGGSYPIVIGAGGVSVSNSYCTGTSGGNSTFNGLTAYGGGGGGGNGQVGLAGGSGGGGGGGGVSGIRAGGAGCSGQGYTGGCGCCWAGGGGGGAGGAGGNYLNYCTPGIGGVGIQSNISGTSQWYAGGGSGMSGYAIYCPAPNGGTASCNSAASNATICGAGGGGTTSISYGCGGGGLFILAYPSSCGYNITGGTKYECNGNCIHCFTGNGTLTIS